MNSVHGVLSCLVLRCMETILGQHGRHDKRRQWRRQRCSEVGHGATVMDQRQLQAGRSMEAAKAATLVTAALLVRRRATAIDQRQPQAGRSMRTGQLRLNSYDINGSTVVDGRWLMYIDDDAHG